MKRLRHTGVLFTLVLLFVCALGVAPALAADPLLSTQATPNLLPSAAATSASAAQLVAPTAVGVDYPLSVVRYDFSRDAEWSTPTEHFIGHFSGITDIHVFGQSWSNPGIGWPAGKHLAYVYDGVAGASVYFDQPQVHAGVWVEPNVIWNIVGDELVPAYFPVTITAYDRWNHIVGTYTKSMSCAIAPGYVGLLSVQQNISWVTITTVAEAVGFAFTDLTYGPGRLGRRGH